ncbi:adenosylmethionine--8-amino-7-oxononanoate transaminase [Rubritalea marina]|uniref:adenosylmethionine--8-amino-7-oxononanoate transaminase n=1 Tax=Rubritalea marina TaxID=361055 RepID=UPI00035E4607|nr:adenosylmethionine--8-amino-7-oxononanoate transaminase [Rubritalea marina]
MWGLDAGMRAQDDSHDHDHWVALDKAHCWHPFTPQDLWCDPQHDPLMLVKGDGVWLEDDAGHRYIDGNASIWTNIHGHAHPTINQAIQQQLSKVSHSSYLGYAHPLASELACELAAQFPDSSLQRVFYSDNGSTAVECALKMAIQYRMQCGEAQRDTFVAFIDGYHGDTMGAASLGGVDAFFARFRKFGFPVEFVRSLEELRALECLGRVAGVIIEPLVQGVNQVHVWPEGMLAELRAFTSEQGIHLILDEVMTGFGRTGKMFACQHEEVVPDFLCLAKGLTGGYLPLAATLVREEIYDAFRGDRSRAFYYGHSYTANPLGCAAALASLQVFAEEQTLERLPAKIQQLSEALQQLQQASPWVHSTRQCGMVAGVELRARDGQAFPANRRVGDAVCLAARQYGLLTRPVLDTIIILPPLSINAEEIHHIFTAITQAISDTLGDSAEIL